MNLSPTDYLLELIEHSLCTNHEQGLALWSVAFDKFFAGWDIPDCRRMLRVVKKSGLASDTDQETKIIGLSAQGMLEIHLGNSDEAVACYKKALDFLQNIEDSKETQAWLWSNLGNIYYLSSRFKDAEASYYHSVQLYQEAGNEKGMTLALSNLGNVLRDSGELEKAIECYRRALAWQQAHDEQEYSAITLTNLGSALQLRGDYDDAEMAYRRALQIFANLGNSHYQAQTLGNLGTLFLETDRLDAALDAFLHDLEIHRQAGNLLDQSQTLNNLAIVYRRKQNLNQARYCYEESLEIKKEIGDQQGELSTLVNYCYLLQEIGAFEDLTNFLYKARALALSINDAKQLPRIEALERELSHR